MVTDRLYSKKYSDVPWTIKRIFVLIVWYCVLKQIFVKELSAALSTNLNDRRRYN